MRSDQTDWLNGSRAYRCTAVFIAASNWAVVCSERATPTTANRSGSNRRYASA